MSNENLGDFRDESKFMRLSEVYCSIEYVNDIIGVISRDLLEKLNNIDDSN
ncbi:hypothetical protein [Petrocella sp. FN5]|uniref:hypothetical protein n=1 Tax=Petrocella sp. FN5 TaxID=3032002 RepID=UPI0023D9C335|nr:hypothetical protein [Petrocella sp. FN5]MDF1618719.1 hypothetical protein [Petrocella sp. FN5]